MLLHKLLDHKRKELVADDGTEGFQLFFGGVHQNLFVVLRNAVVKTKEAFVFRAALLPFGGEQRHQPVRQSLLLGLEISRRRFSSCLSSSSAAERTRAAAAAAAASSALVSGAASPDENDDDDDDSFLKRLRRGIAPQSTGYESRLAEAKGKWTCRAGGDHSEMRDRAKREL